jgi:hypothetical protein
MRIAVALLLLASSARAAPFVDVVTMGPGTALFTRFGHAAICVGDDTAPPDQARCYNFGTADFSKPVAFTWQFLRGRALFWVAEDSWGSVKGSYTGDDRSLWRQRLPLPAEDIVRITGALAASLDEKNRHYLYHHFRDNCTTRVRDVIGGPLSRAGDDTHDGPSFRQYARQGFAGDLPMLLAAELILGRAADEHTTRPQAMFLPDVLREEVTTRLSVQPEAIYTRHAPLRGGSTWLGGALLLAVGALLALFVLLGRRAPRLSLFPAALVLGALGLAYWTMAIVSVMPELRFNENALVFWPTDFLLPWMRGRYLTFRVLVMVALVAGHLVGVFIQPLAPLVLAALPLGCALVVRDTR